MQQPGSFIYLALNGISVLLSGAHLTCFSPSVYSKQLMKRPCVMHTQYILSEVENFAEIIFYGKIILHLHKRRERIKVYVQGNFLDVIVRILEIRKGVCCHPSHIPQPYSLPSLLRETQQGKHSFLVDAIFFSPTLGNILHCIQFYLS